MPLKPPVNEVDHCQGDKAAKIVIVEYGDYQCPHCGRAYPLVKKLQAELGEDLCFVFRNFPLAKIHPDAMMAAIATEAAALQGKYWEMHDILFENQENLDNDALARYAQRLEMDVEKFSSDIADQQFISKVESDFESGIRSGVNATPTFFINGEKYNNGWEGNRILDFIRANDLI
ncbi:MAG: thioredoxin domain-containing protein [Gemmatimonadaceae bacterium]|nr:thioredoxin domain-containing protein [Chitinophagaceae bacterium]